MLRVVVDEGVAGESFEAKFEVEDSEGRAFATEKLMTVRPEGLLLVNMSDTVDEESGFVVVIGVGLDEVKVVKGTLLHVVGRHLAEEGEFEGPLL